MVMLTFTGSSAVKETLQIHSGLSLGGFLTEYQYVFRPIASGGTSLLKSPLATAS